MPRLAPNSAGLARWIPWRRTHTGLDASGAPLEDPLLAAGRRLRQAREERGLSLRQLALDTRISTPVLEALERGWRDRLPEAAYLRTMLPLIEQRLDLPNGHLEVALPAEGPDHGLPRSGGLLQRFTPGSIDVFSTWQGTLLYGVLTLGLIYAINLQQQRIAAANLLSLRPIAAAPEPPQANAHPQEASRTLLTLYPDLRPLQRASRGIGLAALQQGAAQTNANEGPGVLELNLNRASRINLQSDGGQRSSLSGAQGQLVLQLQPPLDLTITPAPAAAEVTWNGTPLAAVAGQPGHYRLPLPAKPPEARRP